jgi:hypothetical protein
MFIGGEKVKNILKKGLLTAAFLVGFSTLKCTETN